MDYEIREMIASEYHYLENFTYEAIFIPEGIEVPPKSIIEEPELKIYYEDFGKANDYALVALVKGKIIGAVWTRIMHDYGYIDDKTHSFAISLYREYRGNGIGKELMKQMLALLKDKGFNQASLAVQKANYALKMYLDVGFEIVSENEQEFIMFCQLR